MKKWLICIVIILIAVTALVAAVTVVSAAKGINSPNLIVFTPGSSGTALSSTSATNILLNNFTVLSQDLLKEESSMYFKALDKSSPELDKVMDKASPKLMDDHKKWIDLATQISKIVADSYSGTLSSANGYAAGEMVRRLSYLKTPLTG